jgi:mono/diheme cytochrome c family protein
MGISGCNSYDQKATGACGGPVIDVSNYRNVGFDQVFATVISPRCLSCHDTEKKDQPALTSYASVMRYVKADSLLASDLYTSLKGAGGDMPKNRDAICSDQMALVKLWIQSGAPQKAGQGHEPVVGVGAPVPPIEIDVLPTFSSISQKVFVPYCVKCHQPHPGEKNPAPDGGIDLTSYDKLMSSDPDSGIPVVSPGSPDFSSLVEVLARAAMPKPTSKPRLSQSVTAVFAKWVSDGAKNN